VKLEIYSINDIEEGSFVLGEVPGTGSVVEPDEEFGVVDSCLHIFEYFTFVSVSFLSFVIVFGEDEIPIRESRGFRFVVIKEEEIVGEFEYSRERWWGYTHEVVAEMVYFVHQCWRVPIGRVIGGSRASRWNIFFVCFVGNVVELLKGLLPCGCSGFGCKCKRAILVGQITITPKGT
jgi:hypothetical protein